MFWFYVILFYAAGVFVSGICVSVCSDHEHTMYCMTDKDCPGLAMILWPLWVAMLLPVIIFAGPFLVFVVGEYLGGWLFAKDNKGGDNDDS